MNWRTEYLSALEARDAREKAPLEAFDAYAKLADRFSALSSATPQPSSHPPQPTSAPSSPDPSKSRSGRALSHRNPTPSGAPDQKAGDDLSRLRADLAEAQRTKFDMQARLKRAVSDLEEARKVGKSGSVRVAGLEAEKATLERRVRDLSEELRGKAKFLENVQDEMISLNLQLNMAEEKTQRLQTENKDLVDRWMARMGREADAMNDASRFS
ncbi:MAG: hypothetical protein M1819_005110 [Sarea resinae]|nr:MAG: hypothetical protein M1819_005110 [Sarea resinae]